jgi:hypothetical protein
MALILLASCLDVDGPQPMDVEELIQMESRDSVDLQPTRAGMCVGWEVIWVPALLIGIVVAAILLV